MSHFKKSKILAEDERKVSVETHESKISSIERIIRNNVALALFDVARQLQDNVPNVSIQVGVGYTLVIAELNNFARAITNPCCVVIPKNWLCFLTCILSAFAVNSGVEFGLKNLFTQAANIVSLLSPFATHKEKEECCEVCVAIIGIFAGLIQVVSGVLGLLSIVVGPETLLGAGFNTISTTLFNLSQVIQCTFTRCKFLPCELSDVFTSLNILITEFVSVNPVFGSDLLPVSSLLASVTVDCLRNVTKATKAEKDIKQAICNLQATIEGVTAPASNPLPAPPASRTTVF